MNVVRTGLRIAGVMAAAGSAALAACERTPSGAIETRPTLVAVNGDPVGLGDAIKVVSSQPLTVQTALDPANFVVTNGCNGLALPGSLALSGDTIIFTPSQALPYLIRIEVRVQNVLNSAGLSLAQPFTFTRTTVAPPVSDVSWNFINAPTQDAVTGISFLDRNTGYITTQGGAFYKTINGGLTFAALYKNPNFSEVVGLYAFGDTLYSNALVASGGSYHAALLRSTDQGVTFGEAATLPPAFFYSLVMRRVANNVVGLMGGQFSSPLVYRFDAPSTIAAASGLPNSGVNLASVGLSTDGTNAYAALYTNPGNGVLYVSHDGGHTFAPFSLGTGPVYSLGGGGFVDATTAVIGGDSSQVFRVNVATGAVQRLGAAQGIPQTGIDATTGKLISYYFLKASFVPGSQVGWLVGIYTAPPNTIGGVILMTRDGGQTFVRQAITGADNNGLLFPGAGDVQALAPDFSVLSGNGGLVAARTSDVQNQAQACSFQQP